MSTETVSGVTSRPLAQDFEQIFREHYQLVYRTACRVTGSPEDAEDVLQTIFLRLLRREVPPDLQNNPCRLAPREQRRAEGARGRNPLPAQFLDLLAAG